MDIKVKLIDGGIMPTKMTAGAAAWDCYAREAIAVGNEPVKIPLGFAIEIPHGYHAKIIPRSSIGLHTPLRMVSTGIIDSDFRGEVHAIYEKIRTTAPVHIVYKGDRICQMIIEKNEECELVEADTLSETKRGENGFGSTGR